MPNEALDTGTKQTMPFVRTQLPPAPAMLNRFTDTIKHAGSLIEQFKGLSTRR